MCFITGRNEVLAKVIFLHLFVILFPGGEYLTRYTPHPGTRYPLPPDQVHPPGTRYTPPRPGTPPPGPGTPPGLQTPEYGQRSAGTHPTGMHSCYTKKIIWFQTIVVHCFRLWSISQICTTLREQLCTLTCWTQNGLLATLVHYRWKTVWSVWRLCCSPTSDRICKLLCKLPLNTTSSSQLSHSLNCSNPSRALKVRLEGIFPIGTWYSFLDLVFSFERDNYDETYKTCPMLLQVYFTSWALS